MVIFCSLVSRLVSLRAAAGVEMSERIAMSAKLRGIGIAFLSSATIGER
jgi:hypothetical protein